jgi:hypothetical protein
MYVCMSVCMSVCLSVCLTVVGAIPGRASCLFAENELAVFGDK